MQGFVTNLEAAATENHFFRKVLYTGEHSQLVLMTLQPGEDIGLEVHHDTDQFFRVDAGEGEVVINGETTKISDGFGFVVPAGAEHNVINTGETELQLYTIYSPAHHPDGTIHKTKAEAMAAEKEEL